MSAVMLILQLMRVKAMELFCPPHLFLYTFARQ